MDVAEDEEEDAVEDEVDSEVIVEEGADREEDSLTVVEEEEVEEGVVVVEDVVEETLDGELAQTLVPELLVSFENFFLFLDSVFSLTFDLLTLLSSRFSTSRRKEDLL